MTDETPFDETVNRDSKNFPAVTRRTTLGLLGAGGLGMITSPVVAGGQSAGVGGSGTKLLFFDDHDVESRSDVHRVVHEADKHDGPVLEPTEPWELTFGSEDLPGNAYVNGTVLYDEDEAIYKMWYQVFTVLVPPLEEYTYYVCYATSEDGINWNKPDLGVYEYEGSTDTNIVDIDDNNNSSPLHPPSVIKDSPVDSEYVATGAGTGLFASPNGVNWTDAGDLPSPDTGGPDSVATQYDTSEGRFISFFQSYPEIRGISRRTIFFSESEDFETWSEPVQVLPAAERDDELAQEYGNEHAEVYRLPVIEYDGVYVGFPSVLFAGGGGSEEVIMQLAFSRDLQNWVREDHTPKIPLGDEGEFDSSMMFGATYGSDVLVVDDEIRVYYGGWDGGHNTTDRGAAVGLATWRLDGFASLANDGGSTGTVTTEAVTVDDEHLLVNADLENEGHVNGRLDVEVLDTDGTVIEGFERENCVTMRGDELRHTMNWEGPASVSDLVGEEVKLRVYLEDGHLYSVQFGADEA